MMWNREMGQQVVNFWLMAVHIRITLFYIFAASSIELYRCSDPMGHNCSLNFFMTTILVWDFPFQFLNTNLRSLGQIFSPNLR